MLLTIGAHNDAEASILGGGESLRFNDELHAGLLVEGCNDGLCLVGDGLA